MGSVLPVVVSVTVVPPMRRGHPEGISYIAGVLSSEGHFNDKRPNGSQKMLF